MYKKERNLTLQIIGILLILIFVLGGIGVIYTMTIGKAQKNADREVFKSSVAYNESAARYLAKSYSEYLKADDEDKQIICEDVRITYPNLDSSKIDNATLRNFYNKCIGGEN